MPPMLVLLLKSRVLRSSVPSSTERLGVLVVLAGVPVVTSGTIPGVLGLAD